MALDPARMEGDARLRWVRVVLVAYGVVSLALWPLMKVWPSGWSREQRGAHSEQMIVALYAVLGVFVLWAARDPLRHRSLIWFTVWSSIAHGGLMAWQSLTDASERGHLLGDVPALLVGALVLGVLMPRGSTWRRRAGDVGGGTEEPGTR